MADEWKLVPVVPTTEMMDAACDHGPDTNSGEFSWYDAANIWAVMIAAAPQPPND